METRIKDSKQGDAENPSVIDQDKKPRRWFNWKIVVIIAVILLLALVRMAKRPRQMELSKPTQAIIAVSKVAREDLFNEMAIPAEFRAYVEVELHAKVSGYLVKMNVDFGDKVQAGQLLATIEVPELIDQLHSAAALQQKAEVDYTNANLMFTRLQTVNQQHSNLVAQQDLDTAQSKNYGAIAAIAAAKADVERYQTLVGYTKITAPFDGVVTRRYADPGALIQGGTSGGQSQPLLRISDNYHLRLDFPVSVKYVRDIHPGQFADVKIDSLGGKTYTGKITRFTDRVNDETRTMTTEMEVINTNLEIVPGMYAAVLLKVEQRTNTLTIPIQASGSDKSNPTVYVVNADGEIEVRPVTLGLETPDKCEVLSGLKEGELVMIGNRTSVHPGQKVETKLLADAPAQ